MKNYVYLCGGMEGYELNQMKTWRQYATTELEKYDIKTMDPTRRVDMHLTSAEYDRNIARRIVKQDLQDIANSTVLLADLRGDQPGKRWGSIAEIAHAHTKNKIIIVLINSQDNLHPFIDFYATEIHTDIDEAIDAVTSYYI